jgi:hypothetical protein
MSCPLSSENIERKNRILYDLLREYEELEFLLDTNFSLLDANKLLLQRIFDSICDIKRMVGNGL